MRRLCCWGGIEMQTPYAVSFRNGQSLAVGEIPVIPIERFRDSVIAAVGGGGRIASFFAVPADGAGVRLYAVLADDGQGTLSVLSCDVQDRYPSLTPDCPQAHLFEREIAEQWGVVPEGHPWLKPVRFHAPFDGRRDVWGRRREQILPSVMKYFQVEGHEVHEVAVGPVHAGIIEPGHFRFQCHGEIVLHLEISLGYQHRGIEEAILRGPEKRLLPFMQTVAGDTSIGHTTAYCQLRESLAGGCVPPKAQAIRGIALELERLANHTGDLGALAGDIGYLPTSSFCGRIRGDFLNMSALLCGNRFGRGLAVPGGVCFDLTPKTAETLAERLTAAKKDVSTAVNLLWNTPSVLARFEDTGVVQSSICRELGMVGVPARACGIAMDCRADFPTGIYQTSPIAVSVWEKGDVFGRAYVRWLEIQKSIDFILGLLASFPEGPIRTEMKPPATNLFCVSLVEGWRGEICHAAITAADGSFRRYKIVDPSFHNWMGLAMALREQQISDFPLCNKSFNLSYCGHDL
ncbi:MAG TPA: NADH-quinone oxidoreductase subunit C [Anaerohalosphaeraceae bacterium]|nr:NADH-quinone oxidoreductase subunit C [Anaerohalosphaeraceae bacterium]